MVLNLSFHPPKPPWRRESEVEFKHTIEDIESLYGSSVNLLALFMLLSMNFTVFGEYENVCTHSVLFAADPSIGLVTTSSSSSLDVLLTWTMCT